MEKENKSTGVYQNHAISVEDCVVVKEKPKSGMYGEMPKIKIGKYTISDMTNEDNCSTVWIEDTKTGEGGQFSKESLSATIEKHYKEHF